MDVRSDGTAWPPSMGDYVRLRNGGALGEIIDVAFVRASCRYTVNVFTPSVAEPITFRLDELESVWEGWPSPFAARRHNRTSASGWRAVRPS
jgi:hypothetical protein